MSQLLEDCLLLGGGLLGIQVRGRHSTTGKIAQRTYLNKPSPPSKSSSTMTLYTRKLECYSPHTAQSQQCQRRSMQFLCSEVQRRETTSTVNLGTMSVFAALVMSSSVWIFKHGDSVHTGHNCPILKQPAVRLPDLALVIEAGRQRQSRLCSRLQATADQAPRSAHL